DIESRPHGRSRVAAIAGRDLTGLNGARQCWKLQVSIGSSCGRRRFGFRVGLDADDVFYNRQSRINVGQSRIDVGEFAFDAVEACLDPADSPFDVIETFIHALIHFFEAVIHALIHFFEAVVYAQVHVFKSVVHEQIRVFEAQVYIFEAFVHAQVQIVDAPVDAGESLIQRDQRDRRHSDENAHVRPVQDEVDRRGSRAPPRSVVLFGLFERLHASPSG
ncbi:MAG: hypothetical protein OXI17_10025, partial [Gammaproteobacteria bacterium]|nr:hypothetical protein [Gammaproteobacteria bacterium]